MLKGNPVDSGQNDMFRERLDRMINMSHRLVTLSKIVKWDWLEAAVSKHYCLNNGRPGGSIRLMMGLLILKAFAFKETLEKAKVALVQEQKSKDKIYSWHAPEVECIAKGKLHKKYEFGCKASFSSTNKSNFIVGAKAFHQRPYDGKTLLTAINQVKKLTGVIPKEAQVDQGYKGHNVTEMNVIISRQKRGVTKAIKKRQKRRNAIEPIIGHCKNDREIGPRNYLQKVLGDQINTISMAIGFNLRKILNAILLSIFYGTNKNQNYTLVHARCQIKPF